MVTLRGEWISYNLFIDSNGEEHIVHPYQYIIDSIQEIDFPQKAFVNCVDHSFGKVIIGFVWEKDLRHDSLL